MIWSGHVQTRLINALDRQGELTQIGDVKRDVGRVVRLVLIITNKKLLYRFLTGPVICQ